MIRHILLPTDGSRSSARATRLAIDLAKGSRARITALHVVRPFAPAYPAADVLPGFPEIYSPEAYKRSTQARAARLLARVTRAAAGSKVRIETAIVEGTSEWKAIVSAAKARRCDAIVMARQGKDPIEKLLLGSVTNKVLAHAGCPVLVCR